MKKPIAIAIGLAVAGTVGVIFWRYRKLSKNKGEVVVIDDKQTPEQEATSVADISTTPKQEVTSVADIFANTPKSNRPMADLPEPKDTPFIISEHDYQMGLYSRFNEMKLVFYQDDGILAIAENDMPVENPVKAIGEEAMWQLEQTEENCMYVHDDAMMMNYEIEIVHGGYADVLSPDDDEDE